MQDCNFGYHFQDIDLGLHGLFDEHFETSYEEWDQVSRVIDGDDVNSSEETEWLKGA